MSVPKTGGLNLAVLTQYKGETKGLPTTVIHLLPIEVLLFVDMLPYYLINRQEGSHTFWTSLGAFLNLKFWLEDALDNQDEKFLTFVLNKLEGGDLGDLLADVAGLSEKKFVNLDVESLRDRKVVVHDEKVCPDKFAKSVLNQIFYLKYKIVDWEGSDNFTTRAKVVIRQPPKRVYCTAEACSKAVYDLESLDNVVKEFFENSPPKRKSSEDTPEEVKKAKVSSQEWQEILRATELIHNDPDGMESSQKSEYIQCAQSEKGDFTIEPEVLTTTTQPEVLTTTTQPEVLTTRTEPEVLTNGRDEITIAEVHQSKEPIHLHFHFGQCIGTHVISYESCDKSFRINLESSNIVQK